MLFSPPPLTFTNILTLSRRCLGAVLLGSALCFTACDDYDDTALWEQVNSNTSRIEALEQWQTETNNNIAALQTLLTTNDMITSVTPVKVGDEVTGYTISFLYSDPITIYNGTQGEAGDTPQIGLVQQENGNWYWTLNGELMADPDGNPIRANGEDGKDGQDGADGEDGQDGADGSDGRPGSTGPQGKPAPTPIISLGENITGGFCYNWDNTTAVEPEDKAWYLSVDNGASWYRISGEDGSSGSTGSTGEQGPAGPQGPQGEKGDSFFAKAPELSEDGSHYIFTLADNTTISVPAYQPISIGEGDGALTVAANGTSNITLTLDEDYTAIVAQITPEDDNTAIATRADNSWSVEADLNDDGTATITVTAPASGKALLDVSLIRADGSKVTASRVLEAVTMVTDATTEITAAGDYRLTGSRSSTLTINGNDINLILDDANVSVSSGNAIAISSGSPTITVVGKGNEVKSEEGAGIYVAEGNTVTITGNGRSDVLTARGGNGGSGIGGNHATCGNIEISNMTVYAHGSNENGDFLSAGIGGSGDNGCGTITIDNATIFAYGASDGGAGNMSTPGIGGGLYGNDKGTYSVITIKNNSQVSVQRGFECSDYIGSGGSRNNPADSPNGIDATVDESSTVTKLN